MYGVFGSSNAPGIFFSDKFAVTRRECHCYLTVSYIDLRVKILPGAGKIAGTGKDLNSQINVGDSQVTVAFSPGDGKFIAEEYARRIAAAKDTIHIASMVIS